MLNFDILKRGLGIVSSPHFVYEFPRKMFPNLYSINWPNFIAWLPLLLEILVNCLFDIGQLFEINLIFLIKPFSYMTKNSRQKFKYLENEKSF